MTLLDQISLFAPPDFAAFALLLIAGVLTGWVIEHPPASRPSVSLLMADVRRGWMRQMALRDNRIFDAQLIGNLRQGTAFFASASLITIGGVLATLGNTDQLIGVAEDLTAISAPAIVWELKLLVTLMFLANAFLKFVWSHRLFGYCAALMGAVPNDVGTSDALARAAQAAEINITATRGFNRGLRALYFALASVAWLLSAWALVVATVLTMAMIWRREFASASRLVLLEGAGEDTAL
ncbi:DUF599 domain-containing protein [Poseidonocella sedimentorum]|uniref:Uncharacterized membrane protein n=1 Tax=Poseidonocella sedimentorum TaxID=871652 RepID=A0A1I6EBT4_9RHOB|nr:DUF599 domain-containing protein [Poseidonocella sedimentorum]SFR15200.1 Uncharacterized membrane protein [Poseidonocella sedimentorum]